VFEKAFAEAPTPNRDGDIIAYVDPDTNESKVLYRPRLGEGHKGIDAGVGRV
jgi:hypothetical protein